jgi:hypothetical protein
MKQKKLKHKPNLIKPKSISLKPSYWNCEEIWKANI